jgi:hypothetical protein
MSPKSLVAIISGNQKPTAALSDKILQLSDKLFFLTRSFLSLSLNMARVYFSSAKEDLKEIVA